MNSHYELLEACENSLETKMGKWFAGDKVIFRGKNLHQELGDKTWFELFLFSVTGRVYSETQVRLLNAIWVCTSYPDPRLWNNRITALAATTRSTPPLAIAASLAASEATIYGHGPNVRSLHFLLNAKRQLTKGQNIQMLIKSEFKQHRAIYGFGRPLHGSDERVPYLMQKLQQSKALDGSYVQLALEVERELKTGRWRLQLNAAGLAAAIVADMGFSVREYHLFMIPSFLAGMPPCFIEAEEKPEGSFFPFRVDRINYKGPEKRTWKS
ncbi:MAG: hypothetical protein OEZ58_08450 [Gammaproteobacteria bacterium]|nr:hypothetical protein [Gammaproteobacteria bacterium]MDH5729006.1 hypothetical protein [Gammaproteobacteria bacterium]